jgi:hypothetical protein
MPTKRKAPSDPPSSKSRSLKAKLVDFCGRFVTLKESKVLRAVAAVVWGGFKDNGLPVYPFAAAARDYEANPETVRQRFHGRASHRDASVAQMRVAPVQERVMKEHMDECAARGIPVGPDDMKEAATMISGEVCGDRWYAGFRERNPDIIGVLARPLEAPRAQALNCSNVTAFFNMLRVLIDKYNILPQNIFNMDEKGVVLGQGGNQYALVDRNAKTVRIVENGNRENVTVIECVCADGTSLRPCVIFKGIRRDLEWGRDNACNARFVCCFPYFCLF